MKNLNILFAVLLTLVIISCSKNDPIPKEPEVNAGCLDSQAVNYNEQAKKDDGSCRYVQEKSKSLLLSFTAIFNPENAQWATPAIRDLYLNNKEHVVPVSVYSMLEDSFYNETANYLRTNLKISRYPTLAEGKSQITFSSTQYDNFLNQVQSLIDSRVAKSPVANVDFTHSISDGVLKIRSVTEFFEKGSGRYNLAIYVMEDKKKYYQYTGNGNYTNEFEHRFVLRGTASGHHSGDLLAEDPAAGTLVISEASLELPSDWNEDNLHIAAVIWKFQSNNSTYINSTYH
ncbi:MAG: Omp28-related outer membrane protein [Bacteroidia bacterium]